MARRVNTRFLIVLTAVVVFLAVAVVVAQKVFMRENPQEFVDAARKLTEEKKYELALKNMRQAVALDQGRPDLWLMYGDAAAKLAGKDVEFTKMAIAAWNKTLEIEPANKEALSRMMEFYLAQMEMGARDFSSVVSPGQAVARKLASVDPNNPRAAAGVHIFTIKGYAAGAQTDPQAVEEAITKLTELGQKDPANPDFPFHVAQAKLFRGQELARLGQPGEAARLYAEADAVMDAAVKSQPENPGMHFRASQVIAMLAGVDRSDGARAKYEPRMKESLAAAKQFAKPTDPLYTEINVAAAAQAQQQKDAAGAEKILRELLANRPNEQVGRMQLAQLLSNTPARRAEAVALLEQPVEAEGLDFARAMQTQSFEVNTLTALADMRLDMYATEPDPAAKPQHMAKFEDAYSKMVARTGEDKVFALRLRGKQQRVQGKHIDAIQTLNRAMTLMDRSDLSRTAAYYDVINMLARSYAETQQTGAAKALLTRIVERYENDPGSRLLLTQLLLQERNVEAARPHIAALEKTIPDHPDVIKFRMRLLDPVKEKEALRAAWARLPETNRLEILDKANTAQAIGESDEAVRLLVALRAKDPSDADVSAMLARVYMTRNEKEKGVQVLQEALKLHPDHQQLRMLLGRAAEETPEQVLQARREMVLKIADPFDRAIQLADLAREEANAAEWFKQLKEAEHLKPTEPRVVEGLFAYHVSQKQWDQAQPLLELMAKNNQDQAGGTLFRFRFAMAKGEHAAALNYARELTQKLPEFATSWLSLGQALQATGRFEEALAPYQQTLEKQNENIDAMRGLVDCYLALNRTDEAKRYIDQGIRTFPGNAGFREAQVTFELNYGDPEKALPAREEAIKTRPEAVQSWVALGHAYIAVARKKLANNDAAAAEANFAKARETLTQAMAKFPDERRAYGQFADLSVATKTFDQAEAALKQFAARDAWQNKPDPGLMLAEVYARAGKIEESTSTLRVLNEKYPNNVEIQLALASVLAQSGKPQDALAALTADDPRILRQRLELMVQLGQLEQADKAIAEALNKTPNAVDLLGFAGFVDMSRNQWDEAVARLRQALDIDPKNQTAQYYLAMVRLRQPQPDLDEAIKLLTTLRDQNPRNTDARLLLAQAYQRRNDVDNAAREMEAALQNEPANKSIRLSLAQLYHGAARWIDAERVLRSGREMPRFANDVDLLRAEARMWVARKDHAKALERTRLAMKAAPNSPQLANDLVNTLLDAKDFKGALAEADRILAADKTAYWAIEARGIAKRNLNDKEGAIADFEAALAAANAMRNDDAATGVIRTMAAQIGVDEALQRIAERAKTENRWRLVSAYLLQSKGDLAGAAEMIERALADYEKLTPGEKESALRFAGALYLGMPQPQVEKAHDVYVKLLQLQPNDISSLNNMACLLAESMNPPRPQEAIQYSTRAYDLMMNAGVREALIMDTQGWVLTLNGQVDKGIDVLRQAVATRSFPDAHYHLAEAYLKKSYPEEAQKQLDLAAQHQAQAKEKKQHVDAALEVKIQDATSRAKEMIRAKSEAKVP